MKETLSAPVHSRTHGKYSSQIFRSVSGLQWSCIDHRGSTTHLYFRTFCSDQESPFFKLLHSENRHKNLSFSDFLFSMTSQIFVQYHDSNFTNIWHFHTRKTNLRFSTNNSGEKNGPKAAEEKTSVRRSVEISWRVETIERCMRKSNLPHM